MIERWDAIRQDPDEYAARIRDPHRRQLNRPGRDARTALEKRRSDLARELTSRLIGADGRDPLVFVHFPAAWSGLEVRPSLVGLTGIAAVWFALSLAIAGQGDERDCPACFVAFKPTRSDARFCSPACKLRAHRLARA